MTRNQLNKDGFDILTKIIIKGSPQLGGDERDLVNYVKDLKIQDEEELVEFYHRVKTIEYEIELQQDNTVQLKRLTRFFTVITSDSGIQARARRYFEGNQEILSEIYKVIR